MKKNLTTIGFFLLAVVGYTQTNVWTGAKDNDWHKSCNWSLNQIPSCSQDVIVPVTGRDPHITGIAHSRTLEIQWTSGAQLYLESSIGGALYVSSTNGGGCSGTPTNNSFACCPGGSALLSYTGGMQTWQVPSCVTSVTIEAWGAQGGSGNASIGGTGARMRGTFAVTGGQVLKILVGGQGGAGNQGGGGGGSFVTDNSNNPLLIAGGGGGGVWDATYNYGTMNATTSSNGQNGYCGGGCPGSIAGSGGSGGGGGGACQIYGSSGSGGGGLTGNGTDCYPTSGGISFINGGAGGATCGPAGSGGYGGGGAGEWCSWTGGGGGGGYSGGGGGTYYGNGGGGGSYNGGSNQSNSDAAATGNGQVSLSW